jgi:hypothetical protein
LKEWKIVEGQDYRKTLTRAPQDVQEEIEKVIIPTMEEYPFVKGRCKELRDRELGLINPY